MNMPLYNVINNRCGVVLEEARWRFLIISAEVAEVQRYLQQLEHNNGGFVALVEKENFADIVNSDMFGVTMNRIVTLVDAMKYIKNYANLTITEMLRKCENIANTLSCYAQQNIVIITLLSAGVGTCDCVSNRRTPPPTGNQVWRTGCHG